MKDNRLRSLLNNGCPSISTRIWSTWPFYVETAGRTGNFDYVEFVAEYAPFTQYDLENIARAAEIHNIGTMIKVDFLNLAYVAQKAVSSGFQAVLFADHKNAKQVRETIALLSPETPEYGGSFGYTNHRFIGAQTHIGQMQHAERIKDIVLAFMIEKEEAVENIEEICSVPGVDMVQFGPSDYCMSMGWNRSEHVEEWKAAERKVIRAALENGVQPRCEIQSVDDAQYYIDLGVKHFSLGDQLNILRNYWMNDGGRMRTIVDKL